MDIDIILKDDISFLKQILLKVCSSNMHDQLEGYQMLEDQIYHMQERAASQQAVS
ncbi:MAG: hypothetical protein ACTSQ8_25945 [Candidatus Helarchaeota archaeon]